MRASERTARSHERPRSTPLSEDRFDPPHATSPGHDAVGVAQEEADPREPSARPATSDRPAAQNSVAAAPRLITNAPNARRSATPTPQMAVLDVSGLDSSQPDGARPRAGRAGKIVVGPGRARAAPLALAARDAPRRRGASAGPAGTRRFGESLHDSIERAAKNYLGTGVSHGHGATGGPPPPTSLIERHRRRKNPGYLIFEISENWA